jgi:hypothetical protein
MARTLMLEPAFLTGYRREAVEMPVATRHASENARRRSLHYVEHTTERDVGRYAATVDSWSEMRANPPIPVSRPYSLPIACVNRAAYTHARHTVWERRFTF